MIDAITVFTLLLFATQASLCLSTSTATITSVSNAVPNDCPTTKLPTVTVYIPDRACMTCTCSKPQISPPCNTPTRYTGSVLDTALLPYLSSCTVMTTCDGTCDCPQTFCTPGRPAATRAVASGSAP